MEEQRFTARTMKAALGKVREALGADALIVQQQTVNGRVEVVAVPDRPDVRLPDAALPDRFRVRLERLGFGSAALTGLPASDWPGAVDLVAAGVPLEPLPTALAEGALRLVGAPGVGKTTTLLRMLLAHVETYGAGSVVVGAGDWERLGGAEPLLIACDLFDVELIELRDGMAMKRLVDAGPGRLTLIDTPGVSQAADLERGVFQEVAGLETVLVAPLSQCDQVLTRSFELFRSLRPARLVASFADVGGRIGWYVGEALRRGMPISWALRAEPLPNGLVPADHAWLTGALLATSAMFEESEIANSILSGRDASVAGGREIAASGHRWA